MNSYWNLSSIEKAHWLLEFTRIYRSFSSVSIEKWEAAILMTCPQTIQSKELYDFLITLHVSPPPLRADSLAEAFAKPENIRLRDQQQIITKPTL